MSLVLGAALLIAVPPSGACAQEELTLPELEGLYRSAVLGWEAAWEVLNTLESQTRRNTLELNAAVAAGNETARNAAYRESLRLSGERRQAQRRVEEKANELKEARGRLRDANAVYLQSLFSQVDTASDPVNRQDLLTFMADTRNRINELLNLEDPPARLEPEPDLTQEPRDGPPELRQKATQLEITAGQYEEQYAYNELQLQSLRRDQVLLRTSNDFLADFTRFDDTTVPTGPPSARTTPQPGQTPPPPGADSLGVEGGFLTLEQRIAVLEALQEEIAERIQAIRVRAGILRRAAGGEWA